MATAFFLCSQGLRRAPLPVSGQQRVHAKDEAMALVLTGLFFIWTPHPAIVTIRVNGD